MFDQGMFNYDINYCRKYFNMNLFTLTLQSINVFKFPISTPAKNVIDQVIKILEIKRLINLMITDFFLY